MSKQAKEATRLSYDPHRYESVDNRISKKKVQVERKFQSAVGPAFVHPEANIQIPDVIPAKPNQINPFSSSSPSFSPVSKRISSTVSSPASTPRALSPSTPNSSRPGSARGQSSGMNESNVKLKGMYREIEIAKQREVELQKKQNLVKQIQTTIRSDSNQKCKEDLRKIDELISRTPHTLESTREWQQMKLKESARAQATPAHIDSIARSVPLQSARNISLASVASLTESSIERQLSYKGSLWKEKNKGYSLYKIP